MDIPAKAPTTAELRYDEPHAYTARTMEGRYGDITGHDILTALESVVAERGADTVTRTGATLADGSLIGAALVRVGVSRPDIARCGDVRAGDVLHALEFNVSARVMNALTNARTYERIGKPGAYVVRAFREGMGAPGQDGFTG